jgi:predicted nucleotidyltransferase
VEVIKEIAPAKIILYGSYATGKSQNDQYGKKHISYDFNSDYDFLVVMKDDNLKTIELTEKIENKCRTHAPINSMVLSIAYVNEGLKKGQFLFVDVIKEGILLYDTGEVEFVEPKDLLPAERKAVAEEYFDYWYNGSLEFYELSQIAYEKAVRENKRLNTSLYLLYQAIEGFYSTVLLVFNGYKPKTHNLDKYRKLTKDLSNETDQLFPLNPKERNDLELFDLLKRSYIGAKYKMDFQVSENELEYIFKRVEKMKENVKRACLNKIQEFSPSI